MKLTRVSVRKYRSIDTAADFNVGDFTVLVGPNNQGKSNLLRAAVLAMEVIEGWSRLPAGIRAGQEVPTELLLRGTGRLGFRGRTSNSRDIGYDWDRDFPLFARDRRGSQKSTVIHLDFELDGDEQAAFRDETEVSTNHKLAIEVSLKDRTVSLAIPKQGRGAHKEKAREIAKFITARVSLLHIPAVRTGSTAMGIADEILTSRRRRLLRSPEYAQLVQQLEVLDKAVVSEVEEMLQATLTRFIPGTESVQIQTRALSRASGLDDIFIDDGVLTPIAAKGDGIQSLVALALTMEWTRSTSHPDRQLIVAVEEPESHLHPGAVHELREVLHGVAETQQVIVTTHSQALINRRNLKQNVIVGARTARPARTLDDLRAALGVRLSDALSAAEVTVISEGYLDDQLLPAVLGQRNAAVHSWVTDGRVLFESAGGGSRIYARALAAKTILTQPVVVLDSDPAGKADVAKLLADGVIDQKAVVQLVRPHCTHSELEDLFVQDAYLATVERVIGFPLNDRQKRVLDLGRDKAWSERLTDVLNKVGVPDPDKLVKKCKYELAGAVLLAIENGESVVRSECAELLDRLVELIKAGLHNR
ncbi:ATP-dependent nuclease [Pseudoclavibacter helvolus]|uniref:ATP-dependent nuclease n=1 Tax=Pseudoclavibacter helvolus TaxID=255205 RepID=UPI0024AD6327|nr:ATP-binding protein [Pseudoclavibacter helvolus]